MTCKYLVMSLYHPQVLRGGAQMVAYDLFDAARADAAYHATFVGAIDANAFPRHNRTGAVVSRLGERDDELLLLTQGFDGFYHLSIDPRRTLALRKLFKETAPDVIHFHHSLLIGLETLQIARDCCPDATIIYTLHEYLPICRHNGHLIKVGSNLTCHTPLPHQCVQCYTDYDVDRYVLRRRMFQTYFENVDAFITPTGYVRDRFVDWGLPRDKIEVIPNGHRAISPNRPVQPPSRRTNVFGFFGQYVDAKGIDVLIDAGIRAARQTDSEVRIRIFGGNKAFASAAYVQKIEKLTANAPENFFLDEIGDYAREGVIDLMGQVDWVVVPSIWPEVFALVVSEAWEAKRPVIASDTGGLGERIRATGSSLLFQPGNAEQLSEVMLRCLDNPELWTSESSSIRGEVSLDEAWKRHKSLFGKASRASAPA
ncbi:MAG: glycosyltransferase [Alphaproteobacteria bacterium]|nr:glycosyltransferase [Alphaproteobacteria bacterium]